MGGKSSTEINRTTIETEINVEIENETKNITNILNETITDTTMNVITENAQKIETKIGGGNTLRVGEMIADGEGSVIDINQAISIESVATAAANLTQDASALSSLASKMSNDVSNKVQNDSAAQASMKQVAALKNTKESAGGINDMLGQVTKMMSGMLAVGDKCDKTTETTIRNKMKTSLKNMTINENDIKNIVKNSFNTSITQKNTASCQLDIQTNNTIEADRIVAKKGGKISVAQSSVVKSVSNCIIGAAQTSKLVNDIAASGVSTGTNDTSNKNAATSSMDSNSSITKSDISKDAIGDMFKSFAGSASSIAMIALLGPIGIVIFYMCCCLCVVLAIVMFFKSSGSSSSPSSSSSSD